ncbi:MAG: tetratricopeptide repeat protein [Candidatus Riflebacteria bacterium]|nr:tetratricopeptide repeat protein [Candidatus Riflebacteria bacterium]
MKKKILLIPLCLLTLSLSQSLLHASSAKKSKLPPELAIFNEADGSIKPAYINKMLREYQISSLKEQEEVIKEFAKVLRKDPENPDANEAYAKMLKDNGRDSLALKHFSKALERSRNPLRIHLNMAEIYEKSGKTSDADLHYTAALQISPENPDALSFKGRKALTEQDPDSAIKYLEKAKRQKPENLELLLALGDAYSLNKYYSAALPNYERASLLKQNDPDILEKLAKLYAAIGRSDKAQEYLNLFNQYSSKSRKAESADNYALARLLAKSGKYEEAAEEYRKLIKLAEEPSIGWFELGELHLSYSNEKEAEKAYKSALKADPKMGAALLKLAEMDLQNNREKQYIAKLEDLKKIKDYREKAQELLDNYKEEKVHRQQTETMNALYDSSTPDSRREEILLELYDKDKQSAESAENLLNYYLERGYYEEAIRWSNRYHTLTNAPDSYKKSKAAELKRKLQQADDELYNGKKPKSASELMQVARSSDVDRQVEKALELLSKTKEYKDDKWVLEKRLDFYYERGNTREANKVINRLKKLGYISDSESKDMKRRLKER